MAFTETTTVQEIVILPLENNVQIKRRTVIEKNGDFVSSKDHYQVYASNSAEAAAILEAANAKAIGDASVATAAKATAEAALSAANAAHTAALAAKDSEIAALEAQVAELAPPTVNGVPQVVTRRQARQALLLAGLLDSVQAAITAIQDTTQRRLAQIEWDDSQNFERQRPLLISLATGLGLTSAQLDQLFVTASGL